MKFTIDFPVRPHLYKFLKHQFGDRFEYSKDEWFASIIDSALIKNRKKRLGNIENVKTYRVILDSDFFERQQINFDINVIEFNNRLDRFFREELFQLMRINKTVYNIKYTTSLRDYLKVLGITEEDINLESLQRHFKRKMKEWEEKNRQLLGRVEKMSTATQ